jgi:multidrug efflux pump subunit AcrA (membrane-fusion protein)
MLFSSSAEEMEGFMKVPLLMTALVASVLAGGCTRQSHPRQSEVDSSAQVEAKLATAKAEAEAATAARLKAETELAKARAEADAASAALAKADVKLATAKSNRTTTFNSTPAGSDENIFVIRSGFGEAIINDFRVGNDGLLYDLTILFHVKDGTKCREDVALVGNDRFVRDEYARVTILDGKYRGKTGWVIRKWLLIE